MNVLSRSVMSREACHMHEGKSKNATQSLPSGHLQYSRDTGSAGKELACKAGDPGSIHGWGRFPGEGIGYPLQYSWASLVAQLVKNPPAMQENWVQPLSWEDTLKEVMATHSSILA